MEFSISDLRNKNFEQTIEVAHHLGVRYIWIMGASRAREMWAQDLLQSAIYTRGWVFQGSLLNCLSRHSTNFFPERMLSSRIIHFTQSQVFWDCSTMSACEKLPEGIPFADGGENVSNEVALQKSKHFPWTRTPWKLSGEVRL